MLRIGVLDPAESTLSALESTVLDRFWSDAELSLVRTWATMSAKLGADAVPLELARILGSNEQAVEDPLIRTELLSFSALGHRVLKGRSDWSDAHRNEVGRQASYAASRVAPSLWLANKRALRFVILAAPTDFADLLRIYVDIRNSPPRDEEVVPVVGRVLALAYGNTGDRSTAAKIEELIENASLTGKSADYFRSLWQEGRDRIVRSLKRDPAIQLLLKKVVAFEHQDWLWPLGNALSRAFEGERGGALRGALISRALLSDLRNRASVLDGPSIVEWANARGNLLRLAATIDEFSDEFSTETADMSGTYPETVFGISEAFLLWHDVNLGSIDRDIEKFGPIEESVAVEPARIRKRLSSRGRRRPTKTARTKR